MQDGRASGSARSGSSARGRRAWLWQSREQLVELESPPSPYGSTFASPVDVSNDGVVVGSLNQRAARWDERGVTLLETDEDPAPLGLTAATAITPDGSHTVGSARFYYPPSPELPTGGSRMPATRWVGADPRPIALPPLDALVSGTGLATGVSDDGRVIVGNLSHVFDGGFADRAFLWVDGAITYFGTSGPNPSFQPPVELLGVSGDGSLAVGRARDVGPVVVTGGRVRSLVDLLENEYGADLHGWNLVLNDWNWVAISGDGRTIVAHGADPDGVERPFEVRLPPACSDGLDNDGDGRVDGDDRGCVGRWDRSEERPHARRGGRSYRRR